MKISIDEDLEKLLPWQLEMEIHGQNYPTVRPSMGSVIQLQSLASLGTSEAMGLIEGLFAEPTPDVASWMPEVTTLVVVRFLQHFNEYVEKNSQAVVDLAKATTGTQARGETTTAPPAGRRRPPKPILT